MTVRFSLVGRDQDGRTIIACGDGAAGYNPFEFHPGGRWERILTGCVLEGRPLTRTEIAPFSRSTRCSHNNDVERQKLKRALRGLVRAGLLVKVSASEQAAWTPSNLGAASVHAFGEAA